MDEYDIKTLDYLAACCHLKNWQGEACTRAGIAQSNPARWRNQGHEPMPSKFRKLRIAVIDMAVESGSLPEGCHHRPMAELIDVAKRGGVA